MTQTQKKLFTDFCMSTYFVNSISVVQDYGCAANCAVCQHFYNTLKSFNPNSGDNQNNYLHLRYIFTNIQRDLICNCPLFFLEIKLIDSNDIVRTLAILSFPAIMCLCVY